jgi:hypothetical protein
MNMVFVFGYLYICDRIWPVSVFDETKLYHHLKHSSAIILLSYQSRVNIQCNILRTSPTHRCDLMHPPPIYFFLHHRHTARYSEDLHLNNLTLPIRPFS